MAPSSKELASLILPDETYGSQFWTLTNKERPLVIAWAEDVLAKVNILVSKHNSERYMLLWNILKWSFKVKYIFFNLRYNVKNETQLSKQ